MASDGSGEGAEKFDLIAPALDAAGIRLTEFQRQRIDRYVELLLHWNRSINLVGDAHRIFSRHLLDCLMLCSLPWPEDGVDVLDIGSGAGLPGIAVAVMRSGARVISLDSVARKITFQQVAAAALELDNFFPRRGDVHQLAGSAEGRGAHDIILVRAFAGLDVLMGLAARLLRPGGELWAMKGRRLAEEQAALSDELRSPFEPSAGEYPYEVPELGVGGVTVVYRKKRQKAINRA